MRLVVGLLIGLTVGLLVSLLVIAPVARADCGGVRSAKPSKSSSKHPRTYLAPLALGDSTMIFALPTLAAEGFDANAHGCRQFPEAIALLGSLRHAHSLPHLVVIALGANGSVTDAYVREALAVLGHSRQLALVTPLEAGGRPGSDAVTVRAEARRHPDQVHVLDWVAFSAGHAAWFQPDRLHLTFAGARAFARLLGQALPLAPPPGHGPAVKPSPGSTPGHAPGPTPPPASCPTRAPDPAAVLGQPGAPGVGQPGQPALPLAPPPLGASVLDPAHPFVTLASTSPAGGGVLESNAESRTTTVELANHNPFTVVGTVGLVTSASAGASPSPSPSPSPSQSAGPGPTPPAAAGTSSPLTCVTLPAGTATTVRIELGRALAKQVGVHQRLAVRVIADLFDHSGHRATVTGVYLLERPLRG